LLLGDFVVVPNVVVVVVVVRGGGGLLWWLAIMGNGFCYRLAHLSMDELLVSPNVWEESERKGAES